MRSIWKGLSAGAGLSAMCLLAGCGGVSAPPVTVTPTPPTTYGATNAAVYVIQADNVAFNDQILGFAAGATGSASPTTTLTTNLHLAGVSVDTTGQIYAAGINAVTGIDTVNVYAANSTGSATPARTITLPYRPVAIAVDNAGSLYVSDTSAEILVYANNATGSATPTQSITGIYSTTTGAAEAIAVDSSSAIYLSVFNQATGLGSILVFGAGATGTAAPVNTISAPTGSAFFGVAVDSAKNIYASTDSTGSAVFSTVVEYQAGATGAATPIKTITGALTLLSSGSSDVGALQLDSSGNIYLPVETQGTNSFGYAIAEFAAGANGNVAPSARFTSASWTNAGAQIAVH